MELSTIAKNTRDKSIDRVSFKYKLNEFAAFAEEILSGNNQSFKTELMAKVGDIGDVCRKRIFSNVSDWSWNVRPSKRARRKTVNIALPDEMWIKILSFFS